MRGRWRARLALLGLLLLNGRARATELWVDATTGSDATGDGSPAAPYRSITRAVAQRDDRVDVLRIGPGLYDAASGERFPITISTSPSSPTRELSLLGAGPGATIIRGGGIAEYCFEMGGNPRFQGLSLDGMGLASSTIGLDLGCAGPDISEVEVLGFATGIHFDAPVFPGQPPMGAALSVRRSFLHGNETGLLATTSRLDGRVDLVWVGFGLEASLVVGNRTGVSFTASCTSCTASPWVSWFIADSTIADNTGDGVVVRADSMAADILLSNNILAFNGGYGIRDDLPLPGPGPAEPVIAYNDLHGNALGPWVRGVAAEPNNIFDDPLLVDRAGGNYHLAAGSPAIDTGPPAATARLDLDGVARPADGDGDGVAVIDRGCYEVVMLRRGSLTRLDPPTPTMAGFFPFGPANPLTPILLPSLHDGDVDPDPGVLDDQSRPLVLYQAMSPSVLLAVKDTAGRSVRFAIR